MIPIIDMQTYLVHNKSLKNTSDMYERWKRDFSHMLICDKSECGAKKRWASRFLEACPQKKKNLQLITCKYKKLTRNGRENTQTRKASKADKTKDTIFNNHLQVLLNQKKSRIFLTFSPYQIKNTKNSWKNSLLSWFFQYPPKIYQK